MARSYSQYCGLAKALDVVGERWTLLVMRELMLGPRRFKHLEAGIPGVGASVLASRLSALEDDGLIRRVRLPPPADTEAYELTENGRRIGPTLVELARFGEQWMGAPAPGDTYRATWAPLKLQVAFDREAARGLTETYEFRIDRYRLSIVIDDGELELVAASRPERTVLLETDGATLLEILAGRADLDEAVAAGRARLEGDRHALRRCVAVFPGLRGGAAALPPARV